MKKKFKLLLVSSLVLAMLMASTPVFARSIGYFNSFELPRWQTVVSTIYRPKTISDAPWVLNINNLTNCSVVDTYLANSNGARRSDYTSVGQGRHEINSWGQAGYEYKAVLMNHVSQWTSGYLTGSWSPDNR